MKPSTCLERMYPCVFVNCENKVCYKCAPSESFPYLCTQHRRVVLKFYLKMKSKYPLLKQNKMFNFKQWRIYERHFPILRWPLFLLEYAMILQKYSTAIRKYVNNRYIHYFDYFISIPDILKSEYQNIVLEEEWISDNDDIDDDTDVVCSIWNPDMNVVFPLHGDRDY